MKVTAYIDTFLSYRLLPIYTYLVGLLAVITTASHLTDHTHEIQIIGNSWFSGGSIPLVQAYSNFLPINLFVGNIYEKLITNDVSVRLFEVFIFSLISNLFYLWLQSLHNGKTTYRNLLLILGVLIISIPGTWQIGINPVKLSLLFLLSAYYFYDRWLKSSKSYWLFGETKQNWRWLLLCGLSLSLLLYTSTFFILFAIPILVSYLKILFKDWQYEVRQGAIILFPTLLLSWVWCSFFSSRNLLLDALRSTALDFRMTTHVSQFDFRNSIIVVLPVLIIFSITLYAIRRDNFWVDRKSWIIGIGVIEGLAVSRAGILTTLPFLLLLALPLYSKKLNLTFCTSLCLLGLVLVLPYRYSDKVNSQLEMSRAQIAESYVEQRLIDSQYVFYYGKGAGFYDLTKLTGSTRFYNSGVFPFDTESLQLVDKFRGDNEANAPLYVVYATDKNSKVPEVPRIEEYFSKHYEKVSVIDGYEILKRK